MKISAEKIKLMTNSANGIQGGDQGEGQNLSTVTSFKYLGEVVSDDGSKTRDSLEYCESHCSSYKTEAKIARIQHISWIKGKAGALPCHFHFSVCL